MACAAVITTGSCETSGIRFIFAFHGPDTRLQRRTRPLKGKLRSARK